MRIKGFEDIEAWQLPGGQPEKEGEISERKVPLNGYFILAWRSSG